MSNFKAKLFAASLVALVPTAAFANQSGTQTGPFLSNYADAQAAAHSIAVNNCQSYGGLQSYQQIGVIQNAGYYAVRFTYVCNA